MAAADWDEVDLMDKDEHIEQASRAMKAMSHPLRLKILCVLGDKEVSVQDIVESLRRPGRPNGDPAPSACR